MCFCDVIVQCFLSNCPSCADYIVDNNVLIAGLTKLSTFWFQQDEVGSVPTGRWLLVTQYPPPKTKREVGVSKYLGGFSFWFLVRLLLCTACHLWPQSRLPKSGFRILCKVLFLGKVQTSPPQSGVLTLLLSSHHIAPPFSFFPMQI